MLTERERETDRRHPTILSGNIKEVEARGEAVTADHRSALLLVQPEIRMPCLSSSSPLVSLAASPLLSLTVSLALSLSLSLFLKLFLFV